VSIYLLNERLGRPLPDDGSQGRWHGVYKNFAGFITAYGTVVYPLCLYGLVVFAWQGIREPILYRRAVCLMMATIFAVVFGFLWRLGAFPFVGD
jgi:hypothetical protein